MIKLETKEAAKEFSKSLGIMPEEEAGLPSPVINDRGKDNTLSQEETKKAKELVQKYQKEKRERDKRVQEQRKI